ncbi:MAG: hypothetical protein OEW05_00370 [Candidatus Aminicenantes bacterium]|nr:hypothetical protein [Candidatus Aminicenantes bacterium]
MKAKLILATLLAAAVAVFVPSCTRGDIDEPGPTGPSSFAIYLKATASTNTLLAADSRGVTTISASLKKYDGAPLSNRTVYFEILDAYFNKQTKAPGYFDGNTTVKVGSTDGSGNVSTAYYGPKGSEMEYVLDQNPQDGIIDQEYVNQEGGNVTYYIRVTAATDGARFVEEFVPIQIICEDLFYSFEMRAYPATLYATSERQRAEIVATVKKGGKPLAGKKIWFEILSPTVGYFEDGLGIQVQTVLDGAGQARVGYFGPLGVELSEDVHVMFSGRAETDTRYPPLEDPPTQGALQVKHYLYIHVVKQK